VVALLIVAGAGVWWWTGRETQKNTAGAAPAKPAVTGVAKQAEAPGARAARLAKEFAALQVRAAELGLADAALAEATMVAGQAQAIEGGAGAAQAAEAWARATDMAGPVVLARVTTLHDAEAAGLREVNLDDHTAAPVRSLARARREANEAARRGAWAEAVARLDEARGLIAPASRAVAEKLAEAGGAAAARGDEAMATFFHVQALRLDAKLESSREHLYRHKYKLGQILRTPAGQELAYAPPGQFLRGSATGEAGRDADETQQQVTLTRGFFIAVSETTQREWDRVFGAGAAARTLRTAKAKPSTVSPELPMHSVTWEQATEYCRRLSELDGMAFRLPTEAEWEHACRAGTTTAFNLGVDGLSARDANIDDGSADAPLAPRAPGASGRANAWGLRDMHGNVWEWCADWSAPYPTEEAATRDPTGPLRESLGRIDLALKVVRGGGWNAPANDARSANRWEYSPAVATDYIGFRVVHDPDLAKP
jgi:formylglycine-generating enzyme required for sulfatase activity